MAPKWHRPSRRTQVISSLGSSQVWQSHSSIRARFNAPYTHQHTRAHACGERADGDWLLSGMQGWVSWRMRSDTQHPSSTKTDSMTWSARNPVCRARTCRAVVLLCQVMIVMFIVLAGNKLRNTNPATCPACPTSHGTRHVFAVGALVWVSWCGSASFC